MAALSTVGLLAGCDGSPLDRSLTGFDTRIASAETLLAEVTAFGDPTPSAALPAGRATYEGYAGFMLAPLADVDEADFRADPGEYADYVSDVSIDVDFASGVTGGSFSDFFDRDGVVTGSLSIAPTGLADLGGDLVFATSASGQIGGEATSVDVEAYFVGPDAEGVLGRGEGDKGGDPISTYFVGAAD